MAENHDVTSPVTITPETRKSNHFWGILVENFRDDAERRAFFTLLVGQHKFTPRYSSSVSKQLTSKVYFKEFTKGADEAIPEMEAILAAFSRDHTHTAPRHCIFKVHNQVETMEDLAKIFEPLEQVEEFA
ncbi:hypothetical protein KIPB_011965 [Kipferlia bialata]|uniref:Uncharacterized protein n=1 Tax=Kipferlia bialata TaxID=797122 RepID=A0A391NZW9_9EUKA|nr:hypothetical protein KIPB_011965 [Kipferlia bialata]|eukprot:g11965.t1